MPASGVARLVKTPFGGSPQNIPILPEANDTAAWFETKDFDLGYSGDKYVDAVILEIDPFDFQENMEVYITHKQRMRDPGTILGPFVVDPSDRKIDCRFEARYLRFRFVDRRPAVLWKLTGIRILGEQMEGRF